MSVDKSCTVGRIVGDSTPHASPSNGEADQAGSCFSPLKNPLTSTQLAQHLSDKGLALGSGGIDGAASAISSLGYYRIKGYLLASAADGCRYAEGSSFDEVMEIVRFDNAIRALFFEYIANVEVFMRAAFSEELSLVYGPDAYENPAVFRDSRVHERSLHRLSDEIERARRSGMPCVVHNLSKYGKLPIWAAMEVSTLGFLSKMIGNLGDAKVARSIAGRFGLSPRQLSNWLKYLTQIRNMCAHHDRLYNKLLTVRPKLFKEHRGIDNARLFPAFIVLFRMLESIDEAQAYRARCQLDDVVRRHPGVDLGPVGFPGNWREVLKVRGAANKGARPRGGGKGRPAKDAAALEEAMRLYDSRECSVAEIVERVGISTSTLYKYIHLREG